MEELIEIASDHGLIPCPTETGPLLRLDLSLEDQQEGETMYIAMETLSSLEEDGPDYWEIERFERKAILGAYIDYTLLEEGDNFPPDTVIVFMRKI